MLKNIKVSEENFDYLWDLKRGRKLKNMDEVISYLKSRELKGGKKK